MTDDADASHRREEVAADPLVLLLGIDPVLAELYVQWLHDDGMRVTEVAARDVITADQAAEASVAVVDLPFPRRGGARLRHYASALPGKPILVLSPTFHAGVAARGAVARELGVAAVVASPVRREALVGVINAVLHRQPAR